MSNFETLNVCEVEKELETNIESGLSSEEAKKRLEENGENKLTEKPRAKWYQVFFNQFKDPMIYVLLAAIVATTCVSIYDTVTVLSSGGTFSFFDTGDWPDVILIMGVIIMNAVIGTIQEIKAETSLESLKKMSSPESTVIRDGKRFKVKSSDLVIGDIVVLEEGDTIGADLRLITSANLKVDESSLTGESVQISKDANLVFTEALGVADRKNIVYMSTPVTYGRGMGIVVKTGMETEIGKIASALDSEEDDQTPLQKILEKLGKTLGLITIGLVVLVFLAELIWFFVKSNQGLIDNPVSAIIDAVLTAIGLAVAAIPEGLAAIVTIVLSIGVQTMVKVNTIVRKLPSVETLGAVSVVCSDKTGTLTQNKMTVVEAWCYGKNYLREDFPKENNEQLKLLSSGLSLCSNATVDEGLYGDPTEIALVVFANEMNMHKRDLESEYKRVDELPFDSVRKMMSTMHFNGNNSRVFTKGALDSIVKHTTKILIDGKVIDITKEHIDNIYKQNANYSDRALRVLALAYKDAQEIVEDDLIFVGLVAMVDPPRPEAKGAVSNFKRAGIITVMITGDHKDTAFAIAKELGIATDKSECFTGAEVDDMTEEELQEVCKKARVFARVSPENKVQIVKAFKANGNIAAMTGDGVNDAPSLKAADIGIAMGINGTDVAKDAADMVLADDNFASIEKAVEEGRGIYLNIKKTILFLLSSNIAEVLAMLLIVIVGLPSPLIAIHLLWVNLLTDSLPAIALGMDPKPADILDHKPRNPKESIFSNGGFATVIGYGASITFAVLFAYLFPAIMSGELLNVRALYETNEVLLHQAQTMAFTTLAISELFHMLGMSNTNISFVKVFKNKNLMMLFAFLAGVVLQLVVIEVPFFQELFNTANLNTNEWLVTVIASLFPLLVHEIIVLIKWIKKKINK